MLTTQARRAPLSSPGLWRGVERNLGGVGAQPKSVDAITGADVCGDLRINTAKLTPGSCTRRHASIAVNGLDRVID